MPIVNIKINYDSVVDPLQRIQKSLDIISLAFTRKYSDALPTDQRREYASIYKKCKDAIVANPQTGDVDFQKSEIDELRSILGSITTTVLESPDFVKLENKFK